jgi:signal transduction histidine kinase
VTRSAENVPFYSPSDLQPAICATAHKNKTVGATCRDFYKTLPFAAGSAKCPFGITIHFQRVKISGQPLYLYQQVSFMPRTDGINTLPRVAKKTAKTAVNTETVKFDARKADEKFELGKEVLSTLLTGRVAESIRALSHHLLTPLQGAIADVGLLKSAQSQDAEVLPRLRRNLDSVNESAKQIQILLSEEAEFSPKKLRKVTVHRLVQNIVDSLKGEAEDRCITIEQGFNSYSREVEAIPDQFQILMSAILQNALKYSFDGFDARWRNIKITYASEASNLVIRVQNEGCGIEAGEISERGIFELGYRGKMSGDRGRNGTDTGLYVADKITKAHGALIRVSSSKVGTPSEAAFQAYENRFELVWPVYSPYKEDSN